MNLNHFLIFSFFPLALIFAHEEHLLTYTLEDLTITSSPLGLGISEITQSSTVLENHELNDLRSDTIANSISLLPGISQTYYGPNANRPIIRGMGGYRVNVLENGLSAFDLSASSNDHAVTINPLLVDRIEILRGSSALIHGSNSIGGIVNVFDNSIPNPSSGDSLNNELRIKTSNVDNGRNVSGILYHQVGDFLFQVNASSINTKDYKTPRFERQGHDHHHHTEYANAINHQYGNTNEPAQMTGAESVPNADGEFLAPEENDEEELVEKVENTHSDINTFGVGGSYQHNNGFIGISYSDYSSEYGVPNHEDSIVSIELEKVSLQSVYNFHSGYFDSIDFRLNHGDYTHSEGANHEESEVDLYEYNEAGTGFSIHEEEHEHEDEGEHHHARFLYEGIDSKLILSKEEADYSTALSISYTDFDMKIDGEGSYLAAIDHLASENEENEEYVEDTEGVDGIIEESSNYRIANDATKRIGIGFMHKKKLSDSLSINGGIRFEDSERNYDAFTRAEHAEDAENANFSREDSTTNASIGFVSKQSEFVTFSGNLHYSERIPETSELYSSGAHHATESFEIGNPNLNNEESLGVEFSLSNYQGAFNQKLSFYYNDYDNFIFQSDTGFKTGTDKWRLATEHDVEHASEAVPPVTLEEGLDFVKAEFEELSIREYRGVEAEVYGLEYEFDYIIDSKRYITGFADTITGNNKTEGISLPRIPPYRIGLSYHQNTGNYSFCLNAVHHGKQDNLGNGEETTDSYTFLNARLGYTHKGSELYFKVNNLTDTLAFVHTSLLKESAPLPGRSIEIGYNLKF